MGSQQKQQDKNHQSPLLMAIKVLFRSGKRRLALQGFGAANHFQDLFGNAGLTLAVCLESHGLDHLARIDVAEVSAPNFLESNAVKTKCLN